MFNSEIQSHNKPATYYPQCAFYFDSPCKTFHGLVWRNWHCRGHEGCNNSRLIGIASGPAQVALLSNRFCSHWPNTINLLSYTVHHLAHMTMLHSQLKCIGVSRVFYFKNISMTSISFSAIQVEMKKAMTPNSWCRTTGIKHIAEELLHQKDTLRTLDTLWVNDAPACFISWQ